MARISGVDLPKNKRIEVALTYILGIGPTTSVEILRKAKIDVSSKVKDLSESEIVSLRELIRGYVTEGDLRRRFSQDVQRLVSIGSYRGSRHKKRLPCRGQRTHTNARTRRGKKVAIAGNKLVTK